MTVKDFRLGRNIRAITDRNLSPDDRVFSVCYTMVRNLLHRIGDKRNIKLSLHDLRRHSATCASRNEVPLKLISNPTQGSTVFTRG